MDNLPPCQKQNHSHYLCQEKPSLTIGEHYRESYGYTCALARSFELFKFHSSLPATRINKGFQFEEKKNDAVS